MIVFVIVIYVLLIYQCHPVYPYALTLHRSLYQSVPSSIASASALTTLSHAKEIYGKVILAATTASSSDSSIGKVIDIHDDGVDGVDASQLSKLYALASTIAVPNNKTATLINLITYGDIWQQQHQQTDITHTDTWDKVVGCMADVRIKTIVITTASSYIEKYAIKATADSRVARGMIAMLSDGLVGTSAATILSMIPEIVVEKCGMSSLLPTGRLNGLVNMIRLIQSQVKGIKDVNMKMDNEKQQQRQVPSWRDNAHNEVAVLLSGGVDSSVVLLSLKLKNIPVRAFYLKIWLEDELAHLNECPWEEDLLYAMKTCEHLQVPLETLSLQKEYWDEVVKYTLAEAKAGRTPNPDIMCNSRIKFGMFYEYVGQYFHRVATGHYAQLIDAIDGSVITDTTIDATNHITNTNSVMLKMSPDPVKDQTYFLSNLSQSQLKKALFPIGHLQKSAVRQLAVQHNLPTKDRPDSQGICFLGKLKFEQFIGHYLGTSIGKIKDYHSNKTIGEHNGLWFHTIGQRKGLGLLLLPGNVHLGPWVVAAKDVDNNILYITNKLEEVDQPRLEFVTGSINWINYSNDEDAIRGLFVNEQLQCYVKLRHGPAIKACTIMTRSSSSSSSVHSRSVEYIVKLSQKDQGIASGQFAAFYTSDNVCLGSGVIV